MKQRLKFHLTGLLLVLYYTMAWGVQPPTQSQNKEPEFSYISQQEANQQAVYNLLYIYTHTPKELTVKPHNPIPSLKNNIRLLLKACDSRTFLQVFFQANNQTYRYFRPDRVDYYIYTLKKIII